MITGKDDFINSPFTDFIEIESEQYQEVNYLSDELTDLSPLKNPLQEESIERQFSSGKLTDTSDEYSLQQFETPESNQENTSLNSEGNQFREATSYGTELINEETAVELNNRYGVQLGWGKYNDQINELLLKVTGQANKTLGGEAFASAVSKWKMKNGFPWWNLNGIIDSDTWKKIQPLLLATTPLSAPGASPSCDLSIAVTRFELTQRQKVDPDLLSPLKSKKAIEWNITFLSKIKIDPQHVLIDLKRYVDISKIAQGIDAYNKAHPSSMVDLGTAPVNAVFAEAVHQFQKKIFFDSSLSDGKAGPGTLHSLGIISFVQQNLFVNKLAKRELQRLKIKVLINGLECNYSNWFNYTYNPSFLGITFKKSIHYLLIKQLRIAEYYLFSLPGFKGDSLVELAVKMGLSSKTEKHSGGRSEGSGMHIYGLAIDIDLKGNPWVGAGWIKNHPEARSFLKTLIKAADPIKLEVKGDTIFNYLDSIGLRKGKNTYDAFNELKQRSDEFISYLKKPKSELEYWKNSRTFAHRDPLNGFLNFDSELVYSLRQKANLGWGAIDFGSGASGDIMHFDMRTIGIGRDINTRKKNAEGKNAHGTDPVKTHPYLLKGGRELKEMFSLNEVEELSLDNEEEDFENWDEPESEEAEYEIEDYLNDEAEFTDGHEESEEQFKENEEGITEEVETSESYTDSKRDGSNYEATYEPDSHEHERYENETIESEFFDNEFDVIPQYGDTKYIPVSVGGGLPLKTGIFLPTGYKRDGYINLIIYFHGHVGKRKGDKWIPNPGFRKDGIEYYWKNYTNIREYFRLNSGNAILIAPTLGSKSSEQYGSLGDPYSFDKFLSSCLSVLKRQGHLSALAMPHQIILAAHSGGGNPMGKILARKNDILSFVSEVWGFDCLYGNWASNYEKWIKSTTGKNSERFFFHFWATSGPKEKGRNLSKLHPNRVFNITPSEKVSHQNVIEHSWRNEINKEPLFHFFNRLKANKTLNQNEDHAPLSENLTYPLQAGNSSFPAINTTNWCEKRDAISYILSQAEIDWYDGDDDRIIPEWEKVLFDDGKTKTISYRQIDYLEEYWKAVRGNDPKPPGYQNIDPRREATRSAQATNSWSAAFISWVMKEAGVKQTDGFEFSGRHITYIVQALSNAVKKDVSKPLWLVSINNPIAVGDILCFNRKADNGVMTGHSIKSLGGWLDKSGNVKDLRKVTGASHCDIVKEITDMGGKRIAIIMGGNKSSGKDISFKEMGKMKKIGRAAAVTVIGKKMELDQNNVVKKAGRLFGIIKLGSLCTTTSTTGSSELETPYYQEFNEELRYEDPSSSYQFDGMSKYDESDTELYDDESMDEDETDDESMDEDETDDESMDEDETDDELMDEDETDDELMDEDETDDELMDEVETDDESMDEDETDDESMDENETDDESMDEVETDGESMDEDGNFETGVISNADNINIFQNNVATPQGLAAVPYGGFDLQSGDKDSNHKYGGVVSVSQAGQRFVAQLQDDLRTLGFGYVGSTSDGDFGTNTQMAVREFQIHSKMSHVALQTQNVSRVYADSLVSVQNTFVYKGIVSGVVNASTRTLINIWKQNNWRCPVIIEAWNMIKGVRDTVAHSNLWKYDDIKDTGPRMFVVDFSRYYQSGTSRPLTDRQVLGDYSRYGSWGGPGSAPPTHTWNEAEILPNASIFLTINATLPVISQLTPSQLSTFRVVRAVSEVECNAFYDGLNAYDNVYMSIPPFHAVLGETIDRNGYGGELGGFISYFSEYFPTAFNRLFGIFGMRATKNWNTNGRDLFKPSRRFTSVISIQNENGTFTPINKTNKSTYHWFRSWHWFYRFAMAGRTSTEYQQALWCYARIRLRGLLSTPWDNILRINYMHNGILGTRIATIGDIFTSEKAVAVILRWHVRFPAHIAANNVAGKVLRTAVNRSGINLTTSLLNITITDEQLLVDNLVAQITKASFRSTITSVRDWPKWAPRTINPAGGKPDDRHFSLDLAFCNALSTTRNANGFPLDIDNLPPSP